MSLQIFEPPDVPVVAHAASGCILRAVMKVFSPLGTGGAVTRRSLVGPISASRSGYEDRDGVELSSGGLYRGGTAMTETQSDLLLKVLSLALVLLVAADFAWVISVAVGTH
jgi:hypothetical protein